MNIIAASLPEYFPSIGFFLKMINSDIFIITDNLQYSKHNLTNRTKIKNSNQWQWLTVQVITSSLGLQSITDINIVKESNWKRKHKTALKSIYKHSPFFEHYFYDLEDIFNSQWESILKLDLKILEIVQEKLRLSTKPKLLSDCKIRKVPTEMIIKLVKVVKGNTYLILDYELEYINKHQLNSAGVKLKVIKPEFYKYPQQFGPFIPNLSIIDVLFNLGNESVQYLNSCIK